MDWVVFAAACFSSWLLFMRLSCFCGVVCLVSMIFFLVGRSFFWFVLVFSKKINQRHQMSCFVQDAENLCWHAQEGLFGCGRLRTCARQRCDQAGR